jgi:PAS domain S-box-containing protein
MKTIEINRKFEMLRERAEEILGEKSQKAGVGYSDYEILGLIHELDVHRVEIELQNDELASAISETKLLAEKYQNLYDFSPVGHYTLSIRGDIIELNLMGAQLLGKDYINLKGSKFGFFVSEETRPVFNFFIEKIFKNGVKETCEVVLTGNNRQSVYVIITGIPTGKGDACLLTAIDISDRIMAEKSLVETDANLHKLLLNNDMLLSIIAHDLRSPFNGIIGFSNVLVEEINDLKPEEIKEYSQIINESARNTLTLLDNLLVWARTKAGLVGFNRERLELTSILKEITNVLKLNAAIKNISLNHLSIDGIMVFADRNMLETIIRNLISNAIKFTNPGGRIDINAVQNADYVEVSIADNGVGMSEETCKKLFLVSTNMTSKGTVGEKGSGLGLLLCKEFVDKHGGKIWAESHEGLGSTFHFTIPAK